MPTVWKNDELFEHHYCGRFPGRQLYSTFDYASQDEDGYFFILGRSDDVINVSGHRLGTREIEETVSSHPAVAEVATVGASDEVRGQSVHCFVVLKKPEDFSSPQAEAVLKREIEATVAETLGAFADLRRFMWSGPFRKRDQARFSGAPFSPLPKEPPLETSVPWKTRWHWMRSRNYSR
jgi:propionyl-CoA synthetase